MASKCGRHSSTVGLWRQRLGRSIKDQKIAAFGSSYIGFACALQELPKAAIF